MGALFFFNFFSHYFSWLDGILLVRWVWDHFLRAGFDSSRSLTGLTWLNQYHFQCIFPFYFGGSSYSLKTINIHIKIFSCYLFSKVSISGCLRLRWLSLSRRDREASSTYFENEFCLLHFWVTFYLPCFWMSWI